MEVDSWITITILVDLIALIFETGAYASPMWLWQQNSAAYFGRGLWYTVCGVSIEGIQCSVSTIEDEGPWLAVKILQSVALAGLLMLTVFLIVYKCGYSGKWGSMGTVNIVAFILCLLTIVILLASAIVFCAYYYNNFDLGDAFDRTSLPWSAMMSFVACLILMLVAYFIRSKCRHDDPHAIPMSGDAKLDFHPQVMNGNAHRYYNQTPYVEEKDRYVVERTHSPIRGYEVYEERRNGGPSFYNRAYQTEPETTLYSSRSLSREIRENRDRELGHTIYTGNGFSYLKEEASRPERDDRYARDDRYRDDRYSRDDRYRGESYGRSLPVVEYVSTRPANDDYYEHRSSIRAYPSSSRNSPSSNTYVYRPHQY